jgi:hypothetical protein
MSTKPLSPNRNHFSKKRTTIETQIASQNRGSSLLFETKRIDICRVGRTSKEDRRKLRSLPRSADTTGLTAGYGVIGWSGLHEKSSAADTRIRSGSPVRATGKRRISFKNTFNKSLHTDTRMPLSNEKRKRRLLKHAGMQEFILFEPSPGPLKRRPVSGTAGRRPRRTGPSAPKLKSAPQSRTEGR